MTIVVCFQVFQASIAKAEKNSNNILQTSIHSIGQLLSSQEYCLEMT